LRPRRPLAVWSGWAYVLDDAFSAHARIQSLRTWRLRQRFRTARLLRGPAVPFSSEGSATPSSSASIGRAEPKGGGTECSTSAASLSSSPSPSAMLAPSQRQPVRLVERGQHSSQPGILAAGAASLAVVSRMSRNNEGISRALSCSACSPLTRELLCQLLDRLPPVARRMRLHFPNRHAGRSRGVHLLRRYMSRQRFFCRHFSFLLVRAARLGARRSCATRPW
jgi:hypothetical protein